MLYKYFPKFTVFNFRGYIPIVSCIFIAFLFTSCNIFDGNDDGKFEVYVRVDLTAEDRAFYRAGFQGENPDLNVSLGDNVRINLEVADGTHDWVVDEFDVATEKISEGESYTVEFLADEKGEFEYYCSHESHREEGMYGTLRVE